MKTSFVSSLVGNCKSALVHVNAFVSTGSTIGLLIVQDRRSLHVIGSHLNSDLLGLRNEKKLSLGEGMEEKGPFQRAGFLINVLLKRPGSHKKNFFLKLINLP